MARWILTLIVALSVPSIGIASSGSGFSAADLDAQLKLFLQWHQGYYDNFAQVVRQSGGPLASPVTSPVYRLRTIYLPIDMPEFGEHVLYVEEFKNNDVNDNARVRLYVVTADEKEQAVKIKIWMPLDPKPLIGSFRDLSRVKKLTKKDMMAFRDVCDVWMQWMGNAFVGGMKDKSCDREDWWYDYDVSVGPDHQWQRDRGRKLSNSDEIVWSLAPGISELWFEQTKAQTYVCDVDGSTSDGAGRMQRIATVELIDQGGEADVTTPAGKAYQLVLFRPSPTVPALTETLVMIVKEKGGTSPATLVHSSADSDQIGFSTGALAASCRRK